LASRYIAACAVSADAWTSDRLDDAADDHDDDDANRLDNAADDHDDDDDRDDDDEGGDCCSLPSLPETSLIESEGLAVEEVDASFNDFAISKKSKLNKDDDGGLAGSFIAWGAMAALVGKPSPTSGAGIAAGGGKRGRCVENLWRCTDENGNSRDDNTCMEDAQSMISLSRSTLSSQDMGDDEHDNGSDDCSLPSLFQLDAYKCGDTISDANLDASFNDFAVTSNNPKMKKDEDGGLAGSLIAWGAMSALVGTNPSTTLAPGGKRGRSVENLWRCSGSEGGESDDHDGASMISLSRSSLSHDDEGECLRPLASRKEPHGGRWKRCGFHL